MKDKNVYLMKRNQICLETVDDIKKGLFRQNVLAGNGEGFDKDGSGKTSSFSNLSSIGSYINSVIIGTAGGS